MNKKNLIICILTPLLIASAIIISNQSNYADQESSKVEYIDLEKIQQDYAQENEIETYYSENLEETMYLVGEYLNNNRELLSKSLEALDNKTIPNEEIVTKVGTVPISIAEIEFRRGLNHLSGNESDASDEFVFNTLVEEKLLINYAIKNGVFPTKGEINQFVEEEKERLLNNEVFCRMTNILCSAANISMEEYFNTYDYYNLSRILIFTNAQEHVFKIATRKGELTNSLRELPDGRQVIDSNVMENQQRYDDYWKQFKLKLKKGSSIKINKRYLDKNFVVDKSSLYT